MALCRACPVVALCCGSVEFSEVRAREVLKQKGGVTSDYFKETNSGLRTKVRSREIGGVQYNTCVFLTDDNQCSVYALRPDVCRMYRCGA